MDIQEVNDIFDAVIIAGEARNLVDMRNAKVEQINSILYEKCGNCSFWMTKKCEPEVKSGRKRSMNSCGCDLFKQKPDPLLEIFQKELAEIDEEIEVFKKKHQ